MKLLKNLAVAAVLGVSSFASQATIVNVGGISWDKDSAIDFYTGFKFNQWFTTAFTDKSSPVLTAASYAGRVAAGDYSNPANLIGKELVGAGTFDFLNENFGATDPGAVGPFCTAGYGTCELSYAFGGVVFTGVDPVTGRTIFDVSKSWLNIYSHSGPDFNYATSSANYANGQNGSLFLGLTFNDFEILNNKFGVGGSSSALLSVRGGGFGGAAALNFNTNTQTGGSDLFLTASVNRGLPDGTLKGGGNATGNTIPEPSSLAVLGLGLIGLAGMARRKKSA